jgi:hypothetical protein
MRTVGGMLKGEKLKARLEELKGAANRHHDAAKRAWRGALEHARDAGVALQEAYERLGRRGRWGRWLRINFQGSARTAREYRRIARQWNHPKLQDAREQGITLNSIAAVLRVLRAEKLSESDSDGSGNSDSFGPLIPIDMMRDAVRKDFAAHIRTLKRVELEILCESFDAYFWDVLYGKLKEAVCLVLEDDFYGEEESASDVNRKIHRALNRQTRRR